MFTSSSTTINNTNAISGIDLAFNSPLPDTLYDTSPAKSSLREDSPKISDKIKGHSKSAKKRKAQIVLNVSDTRYDVVKYVGEALLGWRLSYETGGEWDVFWTDGAVEAEVLSKMRPYQKINHFPGMYCLARKNHLGKHLMRMRKAFPTEYKFFPETYLLPAEYNDFRAHSMRKACTFIVKPEASCQGRGIFLTKTHEDIQPGERYVVQKYLSKPFLLDGLKFDLRVYVLLAGCDPLRIYVYEDGLVRLATEQYVAPSGKNMENMCMHLTNYAVNKANPNFVFNSSENNDNVGHKRSLKALMKSLEEKGYDTTTLWKEIKKLIVKTFCSVQPILAQNYRSCQADDIYNNMCFEILGFDIMLDHKLKPYLLEVNHTPSFTTDTPLDRNIKKNVIQDALKLMNISPETRCSYKKKKRVELRKRILTGKTVKTTSEGRKADIERAQKERDEWESNNHGGYQKIFPVEDHSSSEENYEVYLNEAVKWWESWTGVAVKKNEKRSPSSSDTNRMPPMLFGLGSPTNRPSTRDTPSLMTAKPRRPVHTARTSSFQIPFVNNSTKLDMAANESEAKVLTSPSKTDLNVPWLERIVPFGPSSGKEEEKSGLGSRPGAYQTSSSVQENDLDMIDKRCQAEDDDNDDNHSQLMNKFILRSRNVALKNFENSSLDDKREKVSQDPSEGSPDRNLRQNEFFKIRMGQPNILLRDAFNTSSGNRDNSKPKSPTSKNNPYLNRAYTNSSAFGRYEDISSAHNSRAFPTETTFTDKSTPSTSNSPQLNTQHKRRETIGRLQSQARSIKFSTNMPPKPSPKVSPVTTSSQKFQIQLFNFLSPRTLELRVSNKELVEPQKDAGFNGNRMINRTYLIRDTSKKVLVMNNLFGDDRFGQSNHLYSNIRRK